MQFRTKTILIFLLTSTGIFLLKAASAQNHTPVWNMNQMLFWHPYSNNKNETISDYKHTYQVVLRDSSKIEADSKIWDDVVLHKSYILYIDKKYPKSDHEHRERKIYPNETLNISRIGVDSRDYDATLTGIATDSCWMFQVISGSINAYSYLSEQNDMFNPVTIVGIQKGDGIIHPYNPKNLQQMILGDYDALKDFDNQKYVDAIKKYNRDAKKAEKK